MFKRMISNVHYPNTILRWRCLRGWYPLCTISKHYAKRTMFKRMISSVHHPNTMPQRTYPCAPSKHYPKRTMFKWMISTVHHANTILRGRCLRGWYPLCTIQTLSILRGRCLKRALSKHIHCAPSKHYHKRMMFKRITSTVHHPNTILRGRCLRE